MAQSRQGKRTDPDVRDYIVNHALDNWNAAQILRALEQDERLASRAPGIRTVQKLAREVMTRDGSGRWSVAQASTDELRHVLPALAELCDAGLTCELTFDEAALISKLKGYAEDMPSVTAWRVTRELILATREGQATAPLDLMLSYTPWRDGGLRYVQAYAAGRADWLLITGYRASDEAFSILEGIGYIRAGTRFAMYADEIDPEAAKEARHGAQ